MFHSCTDEIFGHFILRYVGLIPDVLFDIRFWAVSCRYTDKFVLVAPHHTQDDAGWIHFFFAWFIPGIGGDS